MARAGFLHCATSGNAAAMMRVRLLRCGKAGRFLLASLEAKSGSSRPSLLLVRDQQPHGKTVLVLSPPTPVLPSSVSLGATPFSPWGSGVYSRLSLLDDQCLTGSSAKYRQCPSTFVKTRAPFPFPIHSAFRAGKNEHMIHEFNSKLCVVVTRGMSIGKNGITASQLNVFHLCLWRHPPPPKRRKKEKKKKKRSWVVAGCGR